MTKAANQKCTVIRLALVSCSTYDPIVNNIRHSYVIVYRKIFVAYANIVSDAGRSIGRGNLINFIFQYLSVL